MKIWEIAIFYILAFVAGYILGRTWLKGIIKELHLKKEIRQIELKIREDKKKVE